VFARGSDSFGQNVTRFYRKLLNEDFYATYVIIPPQVDRSKTAKDQEDAFMQVGVCREKDGGIVVRGAQMLGTASAISNYLFVSCIVPLQPGDEDYALSFVTPMDSPGLKLYCRPPYAVGKPSVFDYPLSTRFDETDALMVFDDVFVPWENVFVYRDVGLVRAQFFETPAHVLGNNQAQIRLTTKMQFLLGIARKIRKKTYITTGDAEEAYHVVCEEFHEKQRAHTQFWKYLQDLDAMGLIDAKKSEKGVVGKTTMISLSGIPAKSLSDNIETTLKRRRSI